VRIAAPKAQDESVLTPPEDRQLGAVGIEANAARPTMDEIDKLQLLVTADRDETSVR
jgi:hypothetical protein